MKEWWPVRWAREHPTAADGLLAAVLATVSCIGLVTIEAETATSSNRDADALGVALSLTLPALVVVRRRWPVPALWAGVALTVPYWVLDYVDAGASVVVLVLLYSVAAHEDRERALPHALASGAILLAVMIVGVISSEEDLPAIAVVGNVVIFATAWILGNSMRNRRAYLAEVEARVALAEEEQLLAVQRAAQEERTRIARELHDVVAHSVSVMVVQAGAARRVLARNPEQTEESLQVIEATGREALTELRSILGVLRNEGEATGTRPVPSVDDVTVLVEQWRSADMDVDLHLDGEMAELPPGVSLAVYRVLQESLTNVAKHAGAAKATVHVRIDDGDVHVEVLDDGRGVGAAGLPSGGQGLIGMRERVETFGGELEAGPRSGGGFRVRATVPVGTPV